MSTAVGFFQELVGGDVSKAQTGLLHMSSKHNRHLNQAGSAMSNVSSSLLTSEIKEQIEWLHFENFNLLDSSSFTNNNNNNNAKAKFLNSPFANSNILLVIGYKTGFSIWSIDVMKKKR